MVLILISRSMDMDMDMLRLLNVPRLYFNPLGTDVFIPF